MTIPASTHIHTIRIHVPHECTFLKIAWCRAHTFQSPDNTCSQSHIVHSSLVVMPNYYQQSMEANSDIIKEIMSRKYAFTRRLVLWTSELIRYCDRSAGSAPQTHEFWSSPLCLCIYWDSSTWSLTWQLSAFYQPFRINFPHLLFPPYLLH